jgi:ABC-type phosphate transport system substrate-binding protein
MNFGSDGKCIGIPVGGDSKLNQGMSQMFLMMNGARIMVGIQGVAVASSAYLNALEYAKDRKQGSSITNWKDVGWSAGGPIKCFSRVSTSGTRQSFQKLFLGSISTASTAINAYCAAPSNERRT